MTYTLCPTCGKDVSEHTCDGMKHVRSPLEDAADLRYDDELNVPPTTYPLPCRLCHGGSGIHRKDCPLGPDSVEKRLDRIEGMVTEVRDIMHGIINAFGELQNHPMGKMLLKGMKLPEMKKDGE